MGATEKIARFITEATFEDIPAKAIRVAKETMLDAIGVALAGSLEQQGKIITKHVRETKGVPESVVIGGGFRAPAPDAALVNGTLIHSIEYDDTWLPLGHPTCTVLPVVLAIGEVLDLPGEALLLAYVLGLEVHGKLGFGYATQPFQSTPVHGTMAAAAAAAKLLQLDAGQTTMALGIAGSGACGLAANVGSMTKTLHAGLAARHGILSAMLARDGFMANEDIIESFGRAFMGQNFDAEKAVDSLGNPFHLISPGIGIKTYPTCYLNHRPLDALFQIMSEQQFSFDDVKSIEVEVPNERFLNNPKPKNRFQAQFSLQYNLTAALLDRQITLETFRDEKVNELVEKGFLDKVKLIINTNMPQDYSNSYQPVTARLKDGRTFTKRVDKPRGHWENPLPYPDLLTKFRSNAGRVLPPGQVERLIALIEDLDEIEEITKVAEAIGGPIEEPRPRRRRKAIIEPEKK